MNSDILTYYNNNPGAELQDIFKYLHQSSFGPEHLVSDYESAYRYIIEESRSAHLDKITGIEAIGNGYARVHLNMLGSDLTAEALTRVFIRSARLGACLGDGTKRIEEGLTEFLKLIRDGQIDFDYDSAVKSISEWKDAGYSALHHSEAYRDLYHPAYRVVKEEILKNDKYCYHGHGATVSATDSRKYGKITCPDDLYDALTHIWCEYTCAPRLRKDYSSENYTLGQCSITAFLAQDIFGGRVYGVPLPDGNFHCYNVVDGQLFDLTSEQFDKPLYYSKHNPEQLREIHFAKEEKRQRYEYISEKLKEFLQ